MIEFALFAAGIGIGMAIGHSLTRRRRTTPYCAEIVDARAEPVDYNARLHWTPSVTKAGGEAVRVVRE